MTNTTSNTRRVRIEGNGTSLGTRIIDTSTGEAISRVQGYTVTQRVDQVAKAVIDVALPQVSLECEAEVREVPAIQSSASDAAIEAEIQAKGLTAPRVTLADLQANIVHAEIVKHVASSGQILRWAVLTTRCGFAVTGRPSASASAENDNAEIGERVAIENARAELWPLMGYALRERLASAEVAA